MGLRGRSQDFGGRRLTAAGLRGRGQVQGGRRLTSGDLKWRSSCPLKSRWQRTKRTERVRDGQESKKKKDRQNGKREGRIE